MNQEELIEQIVEKASNVALEKMKGQAELDRNPQIPEPDLPQVYGIKLKRKWLWPKCYKVVSHEEERFLQVGESLHPIYPRLILHLEGGRRIAIPNLDSLRYEVYPVSK